MYLLQINIVYLLIRLRQYIKRLKLGEVGYILLLVIFIFKFFKKIKAAKFKPGKGINKEINIGMLNIIKKQYPIIYSK